ncbi:MAG: hypothetical protein ACRDO9_04215 [Gaiellales bacterium]
MRSVRQGAAWIYRILITLFAAAVVVEFFLAGLAIFGAMPGEEGSVSHETFEDKFSGHADLGGSLVGGSLLLLIVILIAWTGPRSIGATFALAVLTIVQMILGRAGEDSSVAGAFHVINALLILGLASFLTSGAWRGNLLIPPSQRPATTERPPAESH